MLLSALGLEQKNVIIQRDRYGYGLIVSGDNPVYVLSVREGGAAQRAGIDVDDQIIKVRGYHRCEPNRVYPRVFDLHL
jgi:predicted metalloprotease with PDZ domain